MSDYRETLDNIDLDSDLEYYQQAKFIDREYIDNKSVNPMSEFILRTIMFALLFATLVYFIAGWKL